jgi:exopolyphosphatase/guanosine-5'-triphosphate,3'-diphosphate pyrophosphatase
MNKTLAAVDIGTNSFHLIVTGYDTKGNFEIIDKEKEVIRLGEGCTGDIKNISDSEMERGVNTLHKFKGIADSHNAPLRAVATSAVREALNKNEFIKKVKRETNLDVEVISGDEEARLIYLGILKSVPIYNKSALCIDIGGGSTEFVLGKKGKINYSMSLKLGAVRLTQMFFPGKKITKASIEACHNWIKGVLFPVYRHLKNKTFELAVGSSGTIMAAGTMIAARKNEGDYKSIHINNFVFTIDELKKLEVDLLKKTTVKERKSIEGLEPRRADIIPAGIILLSTIMSRLNLKELTISEYALREGIILDSLSRIKKEDIAHNLSDIRYESIHQLADSCKYDKAHCMHVANLSLQLFDQLNEIHKLNVDTREYLEAAAILHDIGFHISHAQHHKHGYYIISNSQLMGFNENEIKIIANVARYHRKSHPKNTHKEFESLPEESKNIVQKLSGILRIADSLDRTHSNKIKKVNVEVNEKSISVMPEVKTNLPEIELWNFERRKGLFEEVFGKQLVLEFQEAV